MLRRVFLKAVAASPLAFVLPKAETPVVASENATEPLREWGDWQPVYGKMHYAPLGPWHLVFCGNRFVWLSLADFINLAPKTWPRSEREIKLVFDRLWEDIQARPCVCTKSDSGWKFWTDTEACINAESFDIGRRIVWHGDKGTARVISQDSYSIFKIVQPDVIFEVDPQGSGEPRFYKGSHDGMNLYAWVKDSWRLYL